MTTADRKEAIEKAVVALNTLDPDDPETAHLEADKILLGLVPISVADAYRDARRRVGFWYA